MLGKMKKGWPGGNCFRGGHPFDGCFFQWGSIFSGPWGGLPVRASSLDVSEDGLAVGTKVEAGLVEALAEAFLSLLQVDAGVVDFLVADLAIDHPTGFPMDRLAAGRFS